MADLTTLRKAFKGDIVLPSDPDYDAAIARWAANAVRKAKVVAFVKDEEDVALAIKYAKDNKLPLAIRGGGHSTSGGSSSENGLVIDLSRYLNGVRIDPDRKLAYAGGGAVWKTVDKAAIQHGLAAVAGTVNDTGVGGLTLGGGFGFLMSSHGLVIDNLFQVTIVTANGTKLVANNEENTDLFWAVRGGGSNFGVVTEFVYVLHPQRRTVYAGPLIFLPHALEGVISATQKWWNSDPSEKMGMLHGFVRGPNRSPCIMVLVFYNGTEAEGREAYKFLLDLNPVADHTGEIPYEALNGLQEKFVPPGRGTYVSGMVLSRPDINILQKTFARLVELGDANVNTEFTILFEYVPLKKVLSVPIEATAFAGRRPYPNILFGVRWDDLTKENEEYARDASHEIKAIIAETNVGADKEALQAYGNYDHEGCLPEDIDGIPYSGKSQALYRQNYPRLQAIKKKYDPNVVFSSWFVITPA